MTDTSEYWRKILKIDAPVDLAALAQCHSRLRHLRPVLFRAFNLISDHLFPITLSGARNLPAKFPYILAANHSSLLDYPAVICKLDPSLRDNLYPVATKKFFDNPLAKFFMAMAANVIRIDLEDDFFTALRQAANVLKAGYPVFLFPEGTRSPDGQIHAFKSGLGTLAVELKVPIVPIYIQGAYEVLPPKKNWFVPGKINVIIGQPVYADQLAKDQEKTQAYDVYKEITEEVRARIMAMKGELG